MWPSSTRQIPPCTPSQLDSFGYKRRVFKGTVFKMRLWLLEMKSASKIAKYLVESTPAAELCWRAQDTNTATLTTLQAFGNRQSTIKNLLLTVGAKIESQWIIDIASTEKETWCGWGNRNNLGPQPILRIRSYWSERDYAPSRENITLATTPSRWTILAHRFNCKDQQGLS